MCQLTNGCLFHQILSATLNNPNIGLLFCYSPNYSNMSQIYHTLILSRTWLIPIKLIIPLRWSQQKDTWIIVPVSCSRLAYCITLSIYLSIDLSIYWIYWIYLSIYCRCSTNYDRCWLHSTMWWGKIIIDYIIIMIRFSTYSNNIRYIYP